MKSSTVKTLTEQRIERMWSLEHKEVLGIEKILRTLYIEREWTIGRIADYYVQSKGSICELLKKYKIEKEIKLI